MKGFHPPVHVPLRNRAENVKLPSFHEKGREKKKFGTGVGH